MTIVFCEAYVETTSVGTVVRRVISVTAPTKSSDDDSTDSYSCDVCVDTTVGRLVPSATKTAVTGVTPQRALGQALLRVDSLLHLLCRVGNLRREASNLPYDVDTHCAVPRIAFENAMLMRDAMQEGVSNVILQAEQIAAHSGKPR